MATGQDIENREKDILEMRYENKGYQANVITLRRRRELETSGSKKEKELDDEIKFFEDRISTNDRQVEAKEKQITALIKKQGKITAAPICYKFRRIIYPPSLLA